MLEYALPVAASVFFTLFLRRLDKSNVNLKKVKAIAERAERELADLTLKKKEELKDATIRFDSLLINADKYLGALTEKLEQAKSDLTSVENTRQNLRVMDAELQSLDNTTRSVKDQLKFINESLDKIDQQQKKIKKLQDHVKQVDDEAANMIDAFQAALKDKSGEILTVLEKKFEEITNETLKMQGDLREDLMHRHTDLKGEVEASYEQLEIDLKKSAQDLTQNIESRIQVQIQAVTDLQERIFSAEKNLEVTVPDMIRDIKNDILRDMQDQAQKLETLKLSLSGTEDTMRKKLQAFREELEQQRSLLFHEIATEAERIRDQISNLDLDALAKKDEIIKSARSEAQKINKNIEEFNDQYNRARETLFQEASRRESELAEKLDAIEELNKNISANLASSRSRGLEEMQNELQKALSEIKSASRELFSDIEEDILRESSMLREKLSSVQAEVTDIVQKTEERCENLEAKVADISQNTEKEFANYLKELKKAAEKGLESYKEELTERERQFMQGLNSLDKNLRDKLADADRHFESAQARLEEIVKDARNALHKNTMEIEKSRAEMMRDMDAELGDAVQRFRTRIEEKENEFSAKIEVNIARFFDMKKGLESSQETLIENLQSEKRRIENEIRHTNDQQLKLFDQELTERENRYRGQLTSLSSDSLSDFRGKVSELMDRLMEMKSETTSTFNEFQENQQEVYAAIVEETRATGQEIRELKESLRELKAEGISVEKNRQSAESLRTLIRELSQKIEQAESKNQSIGEVYQRVEEMKEMRTKLETELLMLKDKRDKVDRLEESINFVLGMQNEIEAKSVSLKKLQSNLDEFSAHYAKLDDERRKADVLMQNLIDENRLIQKTIDKIEAQDKHIDSLNDGITQLNGFFQRVEQRSHLLKEQLDTITDQMVGLHKNEKELQSIQSRFMEIEDLMADIDKKKTQIIAFNKQFEELRKSMSTSVQQIEKIEQNAESKVRQLSEFMKAMDDERSSKVTLTKTLSPAGVGDKKEMVRKLSTFGWTAEEIAQRVNLDIHTIETILSLPA
ncbi:MAG: hypothetical protein J0L53_11095 [Spirochaetes bacterium]|nr:hypothetical protein [Spirochaetota bacterium]MBX3723205.1 hypothetical protein [Turneriella sp.]